MAFLAFIEEDLKTQSGWPPDPRRRRAANARPSHDNQLNPAARRMGSRTPVDVLITG